MAQTERFRPVCANGRVLDRGDAAPLQHPPQPRRNLVDYVLPVMLIKCSLEQRRYLLHEFSFPIL